MFQPFQGPEARLAGLVLMLQRKHADFLPQAGDAQPGQATGISYRPQLLDQVVGPALGSRRSCQARGCQVAVDDGVRGGVALQHIQPVGQ